MPKTDQISQIINLIFTVRHLLHEKIMKGKEKCSPLHFITLNFIRGKKPLMKEIADYLTITPPSATALINNFMKLGLVVRINDKSDRRIVRIVLTKKGQTYLKKNLHAISVRMRKGLEGLTQSEQKQMAKILGKVVEGYNK
jgi:DNA-binding MarR family transcriptional regulator